MRVAVVLLDGARAFDVAVVCEVFGRDRTMHGVPRTETVLVAPRRQVALDHAMTARAQPLSAAAEADLVLVPGFWDLGAVLEAQDDPHHVRARQAVVAAHERGAEVASLCLGAFWLARTGLLDGTEVTTHWSQGRSLARLYPNVTVRENVLYTHDPLRRVWTGAGVTAALDLCLAVLASWCGAAAAAVVARFLVLPAQRTGGQAQFVPPRFGRDDTASGALATMQSRVRQDVARPWTLADLARAAGTSTRTLQRRCAEQTGMSPQAWLTVERVEAAKELLQATVLSVEEVARRVGFLHADLLRKHFVAAVGVAPTAYRTAFKTPTDRQRRSAPCLSAGQEMTELSQAPTGVATSSSTSTTEARNPRTWRNWVR